MLGLEITDIAEQQLIELHKSNPKLVGVIEQRITAVRADPGGPERGRTFSLGDGTSARLATYFDFNAGKDVALVWQVEEVVSGGGVVKIIRCQHV